MSAVKEAVEALLRTDSNKATKFISEKEVVRATRRLIGGKIAKTGNIEVTLTFGKPNFAERKYVKALKAAKEPFPVKKVWLKAVPVSKKKAAKKSK